jgi:NADPH oxidase
VFWFTHHLFVLFIVLLCIHGVNAFIDPPSAWMWLIGPSVLYLGERTARVLRGHQSTTLLRAIAHPSKVIELQFSKPSFSYLPGQYLYLNCPYIAKHEWHPFTITSGITFHLMKRILVSLY